MSLASHSSSQEESSLSVDYSKLNQEFNRKVKISDESLPSTPSASIMRETPAQDRLNELVLSELGIADMTLNEEKNSILNLELSRMAVPKKKPRRGPNDEVDVIEILSDDEEKEIIQCKVEEEKIKLLVEAAVLTKSRFEILKALYVSYQLAEIKSIEEKSAKFNAITISYLSKRLKAANGTPFSIQKSYFNNRRSIPSIAEAKFVANEYILFGTDLLSTQALQKIFRAYNPQIRWIDESNVRLVFPDKMQGWNAIVNNVMNEQKFQSFIAEQERSYPSQKSVKGDQKVLEESKSIEAKNTHDLIQEEESGSTNQDAEFSEQFKHTYRLIKSFYDLCPYYEMGFKRRLMVRNAVDFQTTLGAEPKKENAQSINSEEAQEVLKSSRVSKKSVKSKGSEKSHKSSKSQASSTPINTEQEAVSKQNTNKSIDLIDLIESEQYQQNGTNDSAQQNHIVESKAAEIDKKPETAKPRNKYRKFLDVKEQLMREIEKTPSVDFHYEELKEKMNYEAQIVKLKGRPYNKNIPNNQQRAPLKSNLNGSGNFNKKANPHQHGQRYGYERKQYGHRDRHERVYQRGFQQNYRRNHSEYEQHEYVNPNGQLIHSNRWQYCQRDRSRDFGRGRGRGSYNHRSQYGNSSYQQRFQGRRPRMSREQYFESQFERYVHDRDYFAEQAKRNRVYEINSYIQKSKNADDGFNASLGGVESTERLEDLLEGLNDASILSEQAHQKSIIMNGDDSDSGSESCVQDLNFILMDGENGFYPSLNKSVKVHVDTDVPSELPPKRN